jgi:uncharacterized protein YprB with RNaseH-like and TPR domain
VLTHTFCHLPGVGVKTERRFWQDGLSCWEDLSGGAGVDLSPGRADLLRERLEWSRHKLDSRDPAYFSRLLQGGEQWRLFQEFRDSIAYLDIETTGLGNVGDHITSIAVYDGSDIHHFVHGINLDDFVDTIGAYNLLVTYNGKCFDVPWLEQHFGIELPVAHIDLRYLLKSLGYSGGLKRCETQMGLDRGELAGIDGYFAVRLWHDYQQHDNQGALETLLAYNIQDVLTLEELLVMAYNQKLAKTPFAGALSLSQPTLPPNPFKADHETVSRLLSY